MNNLNVDMELLIQSFSFNEFEFGKEYIDKVTGNIINVPGEVWNVVQGKSDEAGLSDWEKELLEDAYSIYNNENRYVVIPTIPDKHVFGFMVGFMDARVDNDILKLKLSKALNSNHAASNFKSVLFEHEGLLDSWYEYEGEMMEQFAKEWLKENNIILG